MNAKYDFAPWLRASLRTGVDVYTEREIWRNSIGACGGWNKKGKVVIVSIMTSSFLPIKNSVIFQLMVLSVQAYIFIKTMS